MQLVMIRGPGGVGKSTIGDLLEQRLQGTYHLDVDLYKRNAPEHLSMEEKRHIGRNEAERRIHTVDYLIVTESFNEPNYRSHIMSYSDTMPITFFITADICNCLERNRQRGFGLSDEHIKKRFYECVPYENDIIVRNVEISSALNKVLMEILGLDKAGNEYWKN
jgi:hypothetical protein